MYKRLKPTTTSIKTPKSVEGETIEVKIRRVVENNEPIEDASPVIYTERKDGVIPDYDIRTDRFEIAVDAKDKIARSHIAKREQNIGERTYDTMDEKQRNEFHEKFPKSKIQRPGGGDESKA